MRVVAVTMSIGGGLFGDSLGADSRNDQTGIAHRRDPQKRVKSSSVPAVEIIVGKSVKRFN